MNGWDGKIFEDHEPLQDELEKVFKDRKLGDAHARARKVLGEIVKKARGLRPQLAEDTRFINQIAGALYAASEHIGGFAVIYEGDRNRVCREVAKKIVEEIKKEYGSIVVPTSRPLHCFPAGTPILMADHTLVPIEKVGIGDHVLACDEQTKELKSTSIISITEAEEDGHYLINPNQNPLGITGSQPLFAQKPGGQEGWIAIEEPRFLYRFSLKISDKLWTSAGEWIAVTDILYVPGKVRVCHFEVEPPHTFFAGGMMAHNKRKGAGKHVLAHNKPVKDIY